MSELPTEETETRPLPARVDPTDQPIPIWPEGVIVLAAGIALGVIAWRHRGWVQRKAAEAQRAYQEFQKHGGVDEVKQLSSQVTGFFKQ